MRTRRDGLGARFDRENRPLVSWRVGYVLQTGRVVLSGAAKDLIGDPLVQEAFLGLGAA
jgi:ABC-type lipopolysaccharide export system ATPase subunit